MYTNFKMVWDYPDSGDYYLHIVGYGKQDATIFDVAIRGEVAEFFYTIPSSVLTAGEFASDFSCSIVGHKAIAGPCTLSLLTISNDTTGYSQLTTGMGVTLSGATLDLTTHHEVVIDRTEYYGDPSSMVFWESHNVSESADITNPSYSYDNLTETASIVTMDTSNIFKLVRDTTTTHGGINGIVTVVASPLNNSDTDILCYIDSTVSTGDTGSYLGLFSKSELTSVKPTRKSFPIDATMMDTLNNNKFLNATLKLTTNQSNSDSTVLYSDSYLTFDRLIENSLSTNHSATVVSNSTPIIWRDVVTTHKVKINSGKVYVFDYYTQGNWWDFGGSNKYTVDDWNYLEEIAQSLGRFYHSPMYYDVQTPYIGNITIIAKANGSFEMFEDCPDSSSIITYTNNDSTRVSGFEIYNSLGKELPVYCPSISPDSMKMDGTYWRLGAYLKNDTTFTYNVYYDDGGIYVPWYNENRLHPFSADTTLHVMFYGKKA